MGVDEATIISLYTNMALAQKVYNDMTAQYKFEVSDADAKVIKVKYIMKKYNFWRVLYERTNHWNDWERDH